MHLRPIALHAGSVLIGQLATIGFGVADTAMVGRYASGDLAALSMAAALYISLYVGLTGVVQALIPVVGHHRGAGESEQVGESFRQAVFLALMLSLPGMALLRWPDPVLQLASAPPELMQRARDYLGWLAWGLPLALLFRCYSGLNQGISRPLLVALLQLGALGLKVPLNAWLIFGGWGLPPLGASGCAVATVVIHLVLVLLAMAMLIGHPIYRPFRLGSGWHGPRWKAQKELLRLGLPAGASYFIEVSAFSAMALFISHFGTETLAGHQIAANIAGVAYMLPLSIAVATAATVAQLRGAGELRQARLAGWQGIGLSLVLSVLLGGLLFLLREPLVGFYTRDAAVRQAALQLITFIAAYQLFDATQITAAFALRSFRVALLPAVAYALSLWGLGLGGGYLLAFDLPGGVPAAVQGARGFWLGNALALALVAVLLIALYQRVSARSAASDTEGKAA